MSGETWVLTNSDDSPAAPIEVGNIDVGTTALATYKATRSGTATLGASFTVLGHDRNGVPLYNRDGKEILDNLWVEAKKTGGSWTPIGGLSQMLDLGTDSTTVELRITIPDTALTAGHVYLHPEIFYVGDE